MEGKPSGLIYPNCWNAISLVRPKSVKVETVRKESKHRGSTQYLNICLCLLGSLELILLIWMKSKAMWNYLQRIGWVRIKGTSALTEGTQQNNTAIYCSIWLPFQVKFEISSSSSSHWIRKLLVNVKMLVHYCYYILETNHLWKLFLGKKPVKCKGLCNVLIHAIWLIVNTWGRLAMLQKTSNALWHFF